MSTKIKGVTLFVYMDGKRKPLVKPTSTAKAIEFMNLLEKTNIIGKEKIEKIVYTDTLFVGVYNKGNFDYDEPNEYFSVDKKTMRALENLSDNGLAYLESSVVAPNLYTTDYSDIYDTVITEISSDVDEGNVNSRTIAGAIKRALSIFGIAYDAGAELVGELKRDIATYLRNAMPEQYQSKSLLSQALYESQQDFQALQQTAEDCYQQLVDDIDDEAVDMLED